LLDGKVASIIDGKKENRGCIHLWMARPLTKSHDKGQRSIFLQKEQESQKKPRKEEANRKAV